LFQGERGNGGNRFKRCSRRAVKAEEGQPDHAVRTEGNAKRPLGKANYPSMFRRRKGLDWAFEGATPGAETDGKGVGFPKARREGSLRWWGEKGTKSCFIMKEGTDRSAIPPVHSKPLRVIFRGKTVSRDVGASRRWPGWHFAEEEGRPAGGGRSSPQKKKRNIPLLRPIREREMAGARGDKNDNLHTSSDRGGMTVKGKKLPL